MGEEGHPKVCTVAVLAQAIKYFHIAVQFVAMPYYCPVAMKAMKCMRAMKAMKATKPTNAMKAMQAMKASKTSAMTAAGASQATEPKTFQELQERCNSFFSLPWSQQQQLCEAAGWDIEEAAALAHSYRLQRRLCSVNEEQEKKRRRKS